jgi:small-conductance mechanosensitive channel
MNAGEISMPPQKLGWLAVGASAAIFTACLIGQANEGVPVKLEGNILFRIRARAGPFSPEDRARAAGAHILATAKDHSIPIDAIVVGPGGANLTNIAAGEEVLVTVTDEDARAAGTDRDALAATYVTRIRSAIEQRRRDYSFRTITPRIVYALLTTLALVLILWVLRKTFPVLRRRIDAGGAATRAVHLQHAELISATRLAGILQQGVTVVQVGVVLLVLYLYVTLLLSFFPLTRDYTPALIGYLLAPLQAAGSAFLAYLPSLVVIAVMGVFAFGCIRLSRFIFHHLATGAITWRGFYPEWARPTHKIVRFLILAFTAVVIFPYLPGSNSPAFRGISIFLGILFSLGSTSAVANVVAGVILTYTRAFKIGDRVKIADTMGDVVETTLLATRVRTIKNEVVTVPNSMVLGAHITNFTARSGGSRALILHTSVTIGYDAPWRTVHDLLVAAALRTNLILSNPKPFVLQTALDDFFVHYEINAYTEQPAEMINIYAELHQNIQDCFNEAGVEIMSPHYSSLRDGNRKAIPDDYVSSEYEAPHFRVGRDRSGAARGGQ